MSTIFTLTLLWAAGGALVFAAVVVILASFHRIGPDRGRAGHQARLAFGSCRTTTPSPSTARPATRPTC